MSLILNQQEIQDVTGFKWKRKQIESLCRMGVAFTVNGAGKLIVLRSDLFNRGKENREEPDLDAI